MAKLTDKQRKQAIAAYVDGDSLRTIASRYKVAPSTIKRIVDNDPQTKQDATDKREENTKDAIEHIQETYEKRRSITDNLLNALDTRTKKVGADVPLRDLTTAYGTLVDKELKLYEIIQKKTGLNIDYKGIPAEILGRAFSDIYRDILDRTYRHFDFKGGRGSLKSSFAALVLVDDIMRNPKKCGMALRQIADTMRDSIYAQIVWAIGMLGLTGEFDCTVSPMKCVRKSTGQVIYFRGGNEPEKIKSIKPPEGMYIGVLWYEEYDQFRGVVAIRSINQSVMRGGEDFIVLRTYNTPISQRHFVNIEAREPNPKRIIHHSHYRQAPHKWLGEAFFEEAEHLKEINMRAYLHEYEGEATGTGLNVFENVAEESITDEQLQTFDRLYYGMDWGWFPHPTAFVECYFNANTQELYIFGEKCRHKTKNADLAEEMKNYKNLIITADTGGGGDRSIADFVSWGFSMTPARKGPGSIEYGIKWLQSLSRIIIDPIRCPNAARQFSLYEYLKDKDGNPITGYPDEEDDFIDAVRYALESVWRHSGK